MTQWPIKHDKVAIAPPLQGAVVPMLRDLFKDESGASTVEYSLLLGLIAMIVMGAITMLGQSLSTVFSNFATTMANTVSS